MSDVALYATVGLKAVKAFQMAMGTGELQAELAWRYGHARDLLTSTASFRDSQMAQSFTAQGRGISRGALSARVMVSTSLGRHGQLSIGYAGLLSRGQVDHGAMLRIRHRF